ncbi:MAG: sugar transferase [Pseudomonadota bacterium]
MSWYQAWGKRLLDLVASTIGLVLLLPLLLLLCVLVLFVDRQSPIFSQTRIGRNGAVFTLFKIRTMPRQTPDLPSHEVDQKTISNLGGFLRKSRLDELPQLVNVATGSMSLVGPRPSLPTQTILISERKARDVLKLRPGITGLAQVVGLDMSNPEQLAQMDAQYAKNISLSGDLTILFRTFAPSKR